MRTHWYSNTDGFPSSSEMSAVEAVRVLPTLGLPVMVGVPVARVFGRGADRATTMVVAELQSASSLFTDVECVEVPFKTWFVLVPVALATSRAVSQIMEPCKDCNVGKPDYANKFLVEYLG